MMNPTPTTNANLPLRVDEFETLTQALDYAAKGDTGFNFYSYRGELLRSLPYAELREEAVVMAQRLAGADLPRGSRVAIIAETNADFFVVFFACQYAGLIPVPLPLPINLGGRDAYVDRLARMIENSGALAVIASEGYQSFVKQATANQAMRLLASADDLRALPSHDRALRRLGADDLSYIQYSSGSTRFPHGVTITQRSVTSNCRGMIKHGLQVRDGDRCVSWLPLYHDMGLVGFSLSPMMSQVSTDYIATTDFARRPLLWLKVHSLNGGTISYSPTFGYSFCVHRVKNGIAASFDLKSWRVAGIGGEMVRPDVLNSFAETFAPSGFKSKAFVASYGLAESTLAVSFAPLDTGMKVDNVDRERYADAHEAVPAKTNGKSAAEKSRPFVVCGGPLPGHEIDIRGEDGNSLAERQVGGVFIKGPSVMAGYFNDPEATARVLSEDGWLDTGDVGYMAEGALVITGRRKDLIICNGRNIWPHDIEWAIESLSDVRSGTVAAFSVEGDDGAEEVVIVVESRISDIEQRQALRRDIAAAVHRSAGVDGEIIFVRPRSLPFTSSGKLSRSAAKANFLDGIYSEPISEMPVPAPASEAAVIAAGD